jgi:hypothetical protein
MPDKPSRSKRAIGYDCGSVTWRWTTTSLRSCRYMPIARERLRASINSLSLTVFPTRGAQSDDMEIRQRGLRFNHREMGHSGASGHVNARRARCRPLPEDARHSLLDESYVRAWYFKPVAYKSHHSLVMDYCATNIRSTLAAQSEKMTPLQCSISGAI